jgi:hypothetical protein
MIKFKELFESQPTVKELKKILKKEGQVDVILLGTDIWVAVDEIDGDMAYGIDQFDKDVEINLKKEKVKLAEASIAGKMAVQDLNLKEAKTITVDVSHIKDQYGDPEQDMDDFYHMMDQLKKYGLKDKDWWYDGDNIVMPAKYKKELYPWDVEIVG